MDTLDLMIEIKKKKPSVGVDVGIHPNGFFTVSIGSNGEYASFYPETPEEVKRVLKLLLGKLDNRELLFKRF